MLTSVLNILAPHHCIVCDCEGAVLCLPCARALPLLPVVRTVADGPVLYAATVHRGVARRLVHALKFARAQAAAADMARIMVERLPAEAHRPDVVTWVPTATSRRRTRGYDQAQLLAQEVARHLRVPCRSLLRRDGQLRQVGRSKEVREQQLQNTFYAPRTVSEEHILLIDDVSTTGSTVRAAAAALTAAGVEQIEVAVFAQA